MATTTQIRLSEISSEISAEMIDEAEALRPRESPARIIVERVTDGLVIADGFHRAAGMLRWAREQGRAPSDVRVLVIDATGHPMLAAAATPGPDQDAAIAAVEADVEAR